MIQFKLLSSFDDDYSKSIDYDHTVYAINIISYDDLEVVNENVKLDIFKHFDLVGHVSFFFYFGYRGLSRHTLDWDNPKQR